MVRSILAFMAVIFFTSAAFTQTTLRPFVGFNSSELSDDLFKDSVSFANNVGFQLGVDFQFGDKFYFQPGAQLEFLRNEINPQEGDKVDFNRTYLRFPVMIGYNFAGADSNFGVRIFTGPNVGFNLASKSDADKVEGETKGAIFGWNGGMGFDFLSILFVDLGYQFGLSEVFKDGEFDSGARNNLFYGNAGLRVRF